ncbi:NYN domain-containing protein [Seongchinamella sediminis]|uniref:NYN domain-containing protein n=1 Tax=Seongchinamella sediminis TaxID=2283635 RepID=A0A3L7DZ21_9GAMM|nr:NYN domain-containing protein [Seongchinamella sediminis]RLQ22466.1 NYN domain-containing protein [Seongchinamella sediminis]
MPETKRIALLIDCDNVTHNAIEGVLEELAKHGTVNVRHAHGDWNNPGLSGWAEKLHPHAIRPMQQFAYTKGKNATDSAMIIDAMDLLYSDNVNAFALMTSDSDFTPLVLRILESGFPVYGFGQKKTPRAFVDACSPFIYIENLASHGDNESDSGTAPPRKSKAKLRQDSALVRLLRTAVDQAADDDGWANMGQVASYIANNNSSFSSINYGYRRISDLIKASELFKIELRNGTAMYVRDPRA